mmetsp:Transcript_116/g.338  ORF Transcript_116/g.338 Transcript_116/m.338 type:complete len:447 (-) Transcript_116:3095-4435(-)
MDDGDGAAPIALTRQAPVAQAVFGLSFAQVMRLEIVDGGVDGRLAGDVRNACEMVDEVHLFGFGGHERLSANFGVVAGHVKGVLHRQAVLAGKVEVALVMGRAAEHGPGAVIHQDKVADPDRQFLVRVDGVFDAHAGVDPLFLGLFHGRLGRVHLAAFVDKGGEVGVFGLKRFGDGMVRGHSNKGRAAHRVGAGGIAQDGAVAIGAHKRNVDTTRLADPVFLHQADLGGPVVEAIEGVFQLACHVGDFEEPLRQLAPLNLGTRTPAFAVDHLFVGKYGHVDWVPVHLGVLAVHQPRLKEIQKQRLLLAVIFRVTGGKFARPVDGQAQRLHLAAHVGDIVVCPGLGVTANGHGGVFGRHAEGVPAHGVQHVVTGRHLIARNHVAHGVVAHMTHVDAARRVGEHLKHIILGLVIAASGAKDARLVPSGLPAGFDFGGCVGGHGESVLV